MMNLGANPIWGEGLGTQGRQQSLKKHRKTKQIDGIPIQTVRKTNSLQRRHQKSKKTSGRTEVRTRKTMKIKEHL